MSIERNIKNYIESHGIKQTFIADKSGIDIKILNAILNERTKITAERLKIVSDVLKVDPNIFLD